MQVCGLTEMNNILLLVSEGQGRRLGVVSKLSKNDVECIWTEVSSYIERQMTLQKGVNLSGLGSFTFSQQNLNTGNRCINVHQPIFILAGKLAQSLGLSQARWSVEAALVPVVPLNFAAVSQQTPFSRDIVEGCVRQTLATLYRALASETNVFLSFKGIGVLSVRNNKVQMKFRRDFIKKISEAHKMLKVSSMRAESSVPELYGEVIEFQRPQTASRFTLPTVCSSQRENRATGKDSGGFSESGDQPSKAEFPQQRDFKSNQSLQMKAVGLTKELIPIPPVAATTRPTVSTALHGAPLKLDQHFKNLSCPGQILPGHELCYLCMQRAVRNVPEYRSKQRDAEEKAQGKRLLLMEQLRDEQEMEQELAKLSEQHEQAKQVAAFNLQMSKKEKSSCSDSDRSFIFPARPITPPKRIQQHRYSSDLQSQMKRKQTLDAQDQQYRLLTERLEQIQLIQEIAIQRAQYFQQKQEKTKHYKKALETQVEDKMHMVSPKCLPDHSRLTRCETAIRKAESQERAQKLFQVNFSLASQRKKEEMQSRQLQLEREREMLKNTKIELMQANNNHFEKKRNIQKSLEDDWSRSVELKHIREDEERRFLRSAGQLLVDKLEECRCCWRCKRRTTNCGETNIWRESRYLSGSNFMI